MNQDDYKICANCGHYKYLHKSNFKSECDACDDPSIPMEKKCPRFREREATAKINP